ncbi:unnamed protein product [Microthlaspi erraticum]|uniref:Leucine-rich repeat-containing N-terminal plant-type domain-containing protein n=1 Tax=Microthlaspi erraticum TaxID=1685480 RepID=A0A6D2IQ54_9BRAS|nr:unnamed protein product [Microthlaspi erraticum]
MDATVFALRGSFQQYFHQFRKINKTRTILCLEYLFGSKNNFTGNIPSFICELRSINILDLSNNNFSGSIPLCMGNLRSNLPESVFENLRSLDVGHNQLAGKLPRSLIHFSNLEVLNVESNRINDTFPFWLSSLQNCKFLSYAPTHSMDPYVKPRSLR